MIVMSWFTLKATSHSLCWRIVVVITRHLWYANSLWIHTYTYILYITSINMAHIGYVIISDDTCFVWINELHLVTFSPPATPALSKTTPDTPDTPATAVSSGKRYLRLANQGCHIVPPRQINGENQGNAVSSETKTLGRFCAFNSEPTTYCGSQDVLSQVTVCVCVNGMMESISAPTLISSPIYGK